MSGAISKKRVSGKKRKAYAEVLEAVFMAEHGWEPGDFPIRLTFGHKKIYCQNLRGGRYRWGYRKLGSWNLKIAAANASPNLSGYQSLSLFRDENNLPNSYLQHLTGFTESLMRLLDAMWKDGIRALEVEIHQPESAHDILALTELAESWKESQTKPNNPA